MTNRNLLLVFIFVLGLPRLGAVEPPRRQPSLQSKFDNDNRYYLARLHQLRQDLDRFKKDRQWQDTLVQMLATQYSFVGRYQKAVEMFDDRLNKTSKDENPTELEGYEAQDAIAALTKLAEQHQVIMINEAHHVPMHRAFTLRLLERLYRKGFRYFAAETLSRRDSALQRRGYPTLQTGWYTHEPVYADLIRTALRLGYKVVPYEYEATRPPTASDDPIAAQNAREEGQAKNLKDRILAKDPKGKILVHAGYAHISNRPQVWNLGGKKGQVRFMAVAFKALTGIEPLSVDQTLMMEHSTRAREPVDYRFAVKKGWVKDQAVVLVKKGSKGCFVPGVVRGIYDVVVFHPPSRYEHGRPTWLLLDGRRQPYAVKTALRPRPGSSLLAQAFIAREAGNGAVPIDQMEFRANEPVPTLCLPAGKILVRIVNDQGRVLQEYMVKDARKDATAPGNPRPPS